MGTLPCGAEGTLQRLSWGIGRFPEQGCRACGDRGLGPGHGWGGAAGVTRDGDLTRWDAPDDHKFAGKDRGKSNQPIVHSAIPPALRAAQPRRGCNARAPGPCTSGLARGRLVSSLHPPGGAILPWLSSPSNTPFMTRVELYSVNWRDRKRQEPQVLSYAPNFENCWAASLHFLVLTPRD